MDKFNTFLDLILEKTFDIQEDVDYIWEKGMLPLVELYKSNPEKYIRLKEKYKDKKPYKVIPSKKLKTPSAVKAHKLNPINIAIKFEGGNHFDFNKKEISISLNSNAVEFLGREGLNNQMAILEHPRIVGEFGESGIKGTISHELAHWMDDTLNEKAASKVAKKHFNTFKNSKASSDYKVRNLARMELGHTGQHEIVANVESIKSLKNNVGEGRWDEMTFQDVVKLKPSFHQHMVSTTLVGDEHYKQYLRKLYTRLRREDLVGDKMHKFFQKGEKIS